LGCKDDEAGDAVASSMQSDAADQSRSQHETEKTFENHSITRFRKMLIVTTADGLAIPAGRPSAEKTNTHEANGGLHGHLSAKVRRYVRQLRSNLISQTSIAKCSMAHLASVLLTSRSICSKARHKCSAVTEEIRIAWSTSVAFAHPTVSAWYVIACSCKETTMSPRAATAIIYGEYITKRAE
jgi:hypothetical protein